MVQDNTIPRQSSYGWVEAAFKKEKKSQGDASSNPL
jgi:hypothetical protein